MGWVGFALGVVVLAATTESDARCGDPAAFIHAVQGATEESPDIDATLTVEAVVVADTQGESGLGGFFVQEEDEDTDADSQSSEGLFVVEETPLVDVGKGDAVRITGVVAEHYGLTALRARDVEVCSRSAAVTPGEIVFPLSSQSELERFEGMAVRVHGPLVVTSTFELARYGEVELAFGERLFQPTEVVEPGATARAQQAANDGRRIQLDDGRALTGPTPPPYLDAEGTLRAGSAVNVVEGVLGFAYGAYEVHPTAKVVFEPSPRPLEPPDVGGSLRVASFNLGNYFVTLDSGEHGCGPSEALECRGARSKMEWALQRKKILAALAALDFDVAALVELQNGGAALSDLAQGLTESTATEYAFVDTGSVGTDAIQVGLVYRPASVLPVGEFALLDSSVDPRFDDRRNRPVLAQTFAVGSGERFTVAVNHLKSKGSDCDAASDPDVGDGQGACNLTRLVAIEAERDWLRGDPTQSGSANLLVLGDLNAYSREDPVRALLEAGYVALTPALGDERAYSYSFEGQFGALDHAFASTDLASRISGARAWHINSDEPAFLDYRGTPDGEPVPFRSSDHDPLLIGVSLALVPPQDCRGGCRIETQSRSVVGRRAAPGRAGCSIVGRDNEPSVGSFSMFALLCLAARRKAAVQRFELVPTFGNLSSVRVPTRRNGKKCRSGRFSPARTDREKCD